MYHIKNDKRSIQSGLQIYEALARLMKEKSYRDIQITELVEGAGLGRSTFYRNFDNIDDVLRYKCRASFDELGKQMKSMIKRGAIDIHGKENADGTFFKHLLRYWYLNSEIIELLIDAERLDIFSDTVESLLWAMIRELPEENVQSLKKHPDYFIAAVSGMISNVLVTWVKKRKVLPPDDLADLIFEQFYSIRRAHTAIMDAKFPPVEQADTVPV